MATDQFIVDSDHMECNDPRFNRVTVCGLSDYMEYFLRSQKLGAIDRCEQ